MAAPGLSKEALLAKLKLATKDKHITVTLRKRGDITAVIKLEGIVTHNHGDSLRFHPDHHEDADATVLIPPAGSDDEVIELVVRGAESFKDIDPWSLKRAGMRSNPLGLVEYDPRSWVKVVSKTTDENMPIVLTMVMSQLDSFYGTVPRQAGSFGTLQPQEEEKAVYREVIQSFITLATKIEMTEGLYEMIAHVVVRLAALRRAQGTDANSDKRKKILAKAYQIHHLSDPKKRDEEWVKYNNQSAGSDPIN